MPSKRFLLSLLMIVGVSAQDLVNPHRTCSENGFCNRFRDWARLPIDKRGIYYVPDGKLPAVRTGVFKVPVKSSRITKVDEPILEAEARKSTFDLGDSTMLQLDHDTVVLALIVDGRVVQTLNEKQMFEVESTRKNYGDICPFGIQQSPDLYLDPACTPEAHPGTWAEEYRGLTDYKPHGPSSVALDITFHGRVPALYGLPEKGTRSLKLKIDGDDDHKLYRFFNLGYAAYSVDSGTSALYGTIPTLTALQVFNESEPPVRTSMLWVNPSDTYIALDRNSEDNSIHSWFLSESGVIDLFLFPQRSSISAMRSYHNVLGYAPLPPYFSLGFHRSHYSYESQQDILDIVKNYTDLHIPVDVFWLDIEHTNGKQ
ncbi:hypothetical protein FOZ63_027515 [Perkinsus olseni]|uniref:Uncharacterized protein n=1 Tax=Perkinsus olseni TaxID=32597 RepID=A0A7J6P5Q9_PEROL|nr:hypothetical protein FOZ63_027515 [Perkinsus olseni]